MPAAGRSAAIWKLADLLEQHADELAQLESLDNGKPVKFARDVDVAGSVEHLRYFAGWPTKIEGETLPVSRAERPRLHAAGAGRRLRADHPVELPAADGGVEARARRWPPAARSSSSPPSRRR